ncbi:thymidylate synthase [Spiroplasma endosymbiont of Nephrotoma flavescens]|uniref:thymidylate synthase n=1 Tax=Spiroplasma endosymbiont of Nephrotoma flavescens TaxID=3066302 RepID=UPI00313E3440
MEQYLSLCRQILEKGQNKPNRTLIDTISFFGYQMRFDLQKGFPLLTTKKVYLKAVIYELLWFIKGDTNIRTLVQNNVNIWNEWPYKKYQNSPDFKGEQLQDFISKIKNDEQFAKKYGDLGPVYGKQWRNFNSFIDFMQIRENNHRLFSEPKVGQRAVPDELDKGMGKNEQCTIVKRQAPPVPVKPAMKPVNWQAKNEQGAKSNLEMDDLKMTLNREIEQVVAKRNECNLYQDEFDSNGNFRTLDNGNKEYGNSQLASILNPVVEEFKQKYNIGNCKTLDEKPDDEFTAL